MLTRRTAACALAGLLATGLLRPLFAQSAAADPAVKDDKQVAVNSRVTVHDITWRKGVFRDTTHNQETITVFLQGGAMKVVKRDGSSTTVTRKTNDVVAEATGDADARGAVDTPVRGIVIDLHNNVVPGIENTTGLPEAFPRPGSKKILETGRVIVWDYTFPQGQASPMHFHSRDVVTVYTEDGTITSTTPDGQKTVTEHFPGEVRFNQRNRSHTETVTRGKVHIIVVELK